MYKLFIYILLISNQKNEKWEVIGKMDGIKSISKEEFNSAGSGGYDWTEVFKIIDKSAGKYLVINVKRICEEKGYKYSGGVTASLSNALEERYKLKRGDSLRTSNGRIYIRIEKKSNKSNKSN